MSILLKVPIFNPFSTPQTSSKLLRNIIAFNCKDITKIHCAVKKRLVLRQWYSTCQYMQQQNVAARLRKLRKKKTCQTVSGRRMEPGASLVRNIRNVLTAIAFCYRFRQRSFFSCIKLVEFLWWQPDIRSLWWLKLILQSWLIRGLLDGDLSAV